MPKLFGGVMPQPSSSLLLWFCLLGDLHAASTEKESSRPAGVVGERTGVHINSERRAEHVHPTAHPTRHASPAPTAGNFQFLGKNVTTAGSNSGDVASGSNSTDDGGVAVIEDQELASSMPPPPQYTAAPLPPSCSSPPAWANDDLLWSDLSDDQRKAALYLGYTSASWDADDDAIIEQLHTALDWSSGLTSDQRLALTYLGYNSGSYENFYSDYTFAELPADVQEAANAVGYTQEVWDKCDEAAHTCANLDDRNWKGLGRKERINMKVIGYDCWTWNNL